MRPTHGLQRRLRLFHPNRHPGRPTETLRGRTGPCFRMVGDGCGLDGESTQLSPVVEGFGFHGDGSEEAERYLRCGG